MAKKRWPLLLKRKKTPPILLSEAKSRETRDALLTGEPLLVDPRYLRARLQSARRWKRLSAPHGLESVDIVATAYETNQPDCSFDTILCTAVLEHLEEPEQALREAYRILRPGGNAIYTAPLFWHLHEEPHDYYRFTKHGLRHLFEKVGFEVVVLHPCGGFWVTFGSEFNYYINSFAKGPIKYIINMLKCVNNLLCLTLDRIHTAEAFAWMYLVVARKP